MSVKNETKARTSKRFTKSNVLQGAAVAGIGAAAFAIAAPAAYALWHQEVSYDYGFTMPIAEQTVISGDRTLNPVIIEGDFNLPSKYTGVVDPNSDVKKLAESKKLRIPITVNREVHGNAGYAETPNIAIDLPFGNKAANADNPLLSKVTVSVWTAPNQEACTSGEVPENAKVITPSDYPLPYNFQTRDIDTIGYAGQDGEVPVKGTYRDDSSESVVCVDMTLPDKIGQTGHHKNTVTVSGVNSETQQKATAEDSWEAEVVQATIDYNEFVDDAKRVVAEKDGGSVIIPTFVGEVKENPATFTPSDTYKYYENGRDSDIRKADAQ